MDLFLRQNTRLQRNLTPVAAAPGWWPAVSMLSLLGASRCLGRVRKPCGEAPGWSPLVTGTPWPRGSKTAPVWTRCAQALPALFKYILSCVGTHGKEETSPDCSQGMDTG